jgi:hypothetical protein
MDIKEINKQLVAIIMDVFHNTKAIIDHTRSTDHSVEYRFDNGYILELYRFDDVSTGLPIHASTSITLYSQSGEIMTEHVYIH